ncbi:MAG: peptide-methionine (S)-S-oxide reductase MsrA [Acidimicrobiia bacterium]|nr:peptide-methionine (S)-S-oxide reductase MsrA [Acidimicrobiia bacterium]
MLEFLTGRKLKMPSPEESLPGRDTPIVAPGDHAVLGTPMAQPFPGASEHLMVGMGCFWGAERAFWSLGGVHTTAVGYGAGITPNPTYEEVCSGRTGHNEVVLVVFRPAELSYDEVLRTFWEGHDPTQGMRQGNDRGTQYRSGIYTTSDSQQQAALASRDRYAEALAAAGRDDEITTEILSAGEFYYAETYHQQYLHKNPGGYCGLGGTGVSCPVGLNVGP